MSYELGFPLQSEQVDNSATVAMAVGATTAAIIFSKMMAAMCTASSEEEPVMITEETDLPGSYSLKQTTDLTVPILAMLSVSSGMSAKDILKKLKVGHPETTKKDVNSNLYKLLAKKVVKKDTSACPLWTMA